MFGSSVCNAFGRDDPDFPDELSVPCVRVECLQPRCFRSLLFFFLAFSTLCSGRVSATPWWCLWYAVGVVFQYPVFGSSVCNCCCAWRWLFRFLFQYPVFGSSVCNWLSVRRFMSSVRLSVPCVRVECLQHQSGAREPKRRTHFQYPVFGSSVCNQADEAQDISMEKLSVPCVRVECLQQCHQVTVTPTPNTFSTLCSGRVFATQRADRAAKDRITFSTLCSGRVSATRNRGDPRH